MMRIRTHSLWLAAALLASCGDGGSGITPATGNVGASPTPSPAPIPSPTPTPSPSPSPTPAPTPTSAAIEPYALGTLGYTLDPAIPADKLAAIRDAMDFAVSHTNTLGAFTGNVWVTFGAGTPTADASYRGQIRFGGSIGRRVALHELAHWFGSGSTDNWARNVAGGRFTGARTVARIRAFDGAGAWLNADGQHFWPYGLNYDNEFSETQRNTQIVSAQVADMGLGDDAVTAIAGTRRFQNRSSGNVLQASTAFTTGATAPTQGASVTGGTQQWRIVYADGFITLASVADGRMIEATATGDGWFLLRNRQTRNCLDNIGDLAAGATIRLWGCGWHPNQQWRLIR